MKESQLAKYLVVGGIGYVVNLTTFWLAVTLGMAPYAAIVPAFITTTTCNFLLNRIWTFEGGGDQGIFSESWKFLIIAFASLAGNYIAFSILYSGLHLHHVLAEALAVIAAIPIGYLGSKQWAFSRSNG